jgi:hypothetical protein
MNRWCGSLRAILKTASAFYHHEPWVALSPRGTMRLQPELKYTVGEQDSLRRHGQQRPCESVQSDC